MPRLRFHRLIVLSAAVLAAGSVQVGVAQSADTAATAISAKLTLNPIAEEVLGAMDKSADPCVDFYQYACGGWVANTRLPSDQNRWVRSFSVIDLRNQELLRTLMEDAAANPGTDAGNLERQQIGAFYASCMDEAAIDKAGSAPLAPTLARIDGLTDGKQAFTYAAELQHNGVNAFFGFGSTPDFKHPDRNQAIVIQGGLGMPDRDYYVSDDPKKKELLAAYEKHVARMLGLAGETAAAATVDAKAIVAFETELAKVARARRDLRDAEKRYNPTDRTGLEMQTPGLPWQGFFTAIGVPATNDINVATPEFFTALDRLLATTPLPALKAYLRWKVIAAAADYLSKPFVDADFEFFGKTVRGQAEIEPRWKRCVDATEGALGEAVGKLYVDRQFAGDSKKVALEMIGDIEASFAANLPGLAWMDDATRGRAIEKMRAVRNKIGYPDTWRDYSKLTIVRDSLIANARAAAAFESDYDLAKIGKPVDRNEWGITPQTVNAYYNPLLNEIAFPAGILQPPFFQRDFPGAMNYGAVGAVMGHELTHGFDDQGRKFDPQGELREWWEPAVAERFQAQAACVEKQYSAYEIEPGTHLDGKLTLGENIADIGGVKQAYGAYQAYRARHPEEGADAASVVAGLTDEQLFFVAFGQVWCGLTTPEAARVRVTVDPHSPSRFRVIGPLSDNAELAKAFNCPAGSPMNPTNRCTVW
jgi:endothelin-converting enzyme/putative endopeptidase